MLERRGGREVECAALEMRFTGNRNVGSNPTLSAKNDVISVIFGQNYFLPTRQPTIIFIARNVIRVNDLCS